VLAQAIVTYNACIMSPTELLAEALRIAREGDPEKAAQLLRDARAHSPLPESHLSLLFQLVSKNGANAEAIEVAGAGLDGAKTVLARSTWALRRGLAYLERQRRDAALSDLQLVLKLKANEGHTEQALAGLLRVAQLGKTKQ